jgi:hypothetical protein
VLIFARLGPSLWFADSKRATILIILNNPAPPHLTVADVADRFLVPAPQMHERVIINALLQTGGVKQRCRPARRPKGGDGPASGWNKANALRIIVP